MTCSCKGNSLEETKATPQLYGRSYMTLRSVLHVIPFKSPVRVTNVPEDLTELICGQRRRRLPHTHLARECYVC